LKELKMEDYKPLKLPLEANIKVSAEMGQPLGTIDHQHVRG